MTKPIHTVIRDNDRIVRADYSGGAYIELTFGATAYAAPTEVINVWDCETGEPTIPCTAKAVRAEVAEWIADNDREWPEWYESYLENR